MSKIFESIDKLFESNNEYKLTFCDLQDKIIKNEDFNDEKMAYNALKKYKDEYKELSYKSEVRSMYITDPDNFIIYATEYPSWRIEKY